VDAIKGKDMTKPDTTRPKRLSAEGIGKAINFSPTLKQRTCFDALMARTGKTQARLGREAITMYLESQGFSKADQGIEE
jgi:predicted DNA-binding protein